MSPRPREDPERAGRQAHAGELLLAVAARLLGEARLGGEFPTGAGALDDFASRLSPELEADEHVLTAGEEPAGLPRADFKVELGEPEPAAIEISCRYDSHTEYGRLGIDGILDEQGGSTGYGPASPETRIELSPLEQEVMSRVAEQRRERGGRAPHFQGEEFIRALAVAPQPGAVVQILAAELFGDGLIVRYTYDDPVEVRSRVPLDYYELAGVEPPIEELLAEAEAEGGNLEPAVSLADDLGTRYANSGGGRGGVQVAHGEARFTPAVPAAATRLIVSSYAGTVDVAL
jgi:hypothetical protein